MWIIENLVGILHFRTHRKNCIGMVLIGMVQFLLVIHADTDESVVIPPIDNPLSTAVQEILLREIDPDNDDVDSE